MTGLAEGLEVGRIKPPLERHAPRNNMIHLHLFLFRAAADAARVALQMAGPQLAPVRPQTAGGGTRPIRVEPGLALGRPLHLAGAEDACRDTWNWQSKNPTGYQKS